MLNNSDKKPTTVRINEGTILARLWRIIVTDLKLIDRLDGMLMNYHTRYKPDLNSISTIKKKSLSTVREDAYSTSITWKSFINLMFNVLNMKRLRLIVELEDMLGRKSVHELTTLSNTKVAIVDDTIVSVKELVLASPYIMSLSDKKTLNSLYGDWSRTDILEAEELQYQVICNTDTMLETSFTYTDSSDPDEYKLPTTYKGKVLSDYDINKAGLLWETLEHYNTNELLKKEWLEWK